MPRRDHSLRGIFRKPVNNRYFFEKAGRQEKQQGIIFKGCFGV